MGKKPLPRGCRHVGQETPDGCLDGAVQVLSVLEFPQVAVYAAKSEALRGCTEESSFHAVLEDALCVSAGPCLLLWEGILGTARLCMSG